MPMHVDNMHSQCINDYYRENKGWYTRKVVHFQRVSNSCPLHVHHLGNKLKSWKLLACACTFPRVSNLCTTWEMNSDLGNWLVHVHFQESAQLGNPGLSCCNILYFPMRLIQYAAAEITRPNLPSPRES